MGSTGFNKGGKGVALFGFCTTEANKDYPRTFDRISFLGEYFSLWPKVFSLLSLHSQHVSLKGQCHEIFCFWFFS
jgi:hypothetical protein